MPIIQGACGRHSNAGGDPRARASQACDCYQYPQLESGS